ncbi:hypothetical protein ACLB2K_070499 [Fragaria x ananassa]
MAFLMEIGTAIVTKLAEYTVEPVIRQVGYVICYKNNLIELQSQVDDLVDARTSMQHSVEAEERKGKKIETGVQNWLTKAEQLTKEADEVKAKHLAQTKCLHGFCPNLKLRHRLSRKSTKLVQEVAKLCEKKKGFDNIAYVAPLEEVCAIAIQDYEAFDSRISTAEAVINELRNFNTYTIGVYGIGGVGKTTLVKEVYNQLTVTSEKLFEEVVMVLDLKQNPSIERIQKAIAEKLGLELPETGTSGGRASLICNRIKGKKTLVILDDVWESIDLEAVGLPRMATLKILLTSRSKLVLAEDMGTQKEFHLKVLNKEETWRLFKKMAGDIVEKPDIQTIAAKVAEKCGGLPLLIVTVARSLKDSPIHDWKDTFRRLKKFDGKGLVDKTHSAIEWSYNKLDSEELKSVFLLCASEAWRANGEILNLLEYSMGLGFIKNVDTMEEARDALNSLLKKLQYSCLLLDTDDNKWFRIHDLVKHVAQHIAARDHHVLSVSYGSELKEWPDKEFCEKCTRISFKWCQTPELPEVLQCPELTMFHISSFDVDSREIPSNFFKEMKKLKVLDLTNRSIASLPPSLKCLKDLQTLCLDLCTLGDLALVGELHNLKMLSLLYSRFKQLPKEIGQLTRLQLLDLTGCSQLEVISPDVISKLKRLEELRMGKNSFNKWEAGRVGETKRSNASLEELKYLPRLTALHIHIPDATILPANLFTTSKLERFQICIGSVWKWDDVDEALTALKLKLTTNNELDQGLKMLLKRTQDLYVEGMEGVNDKFFRELATGGCQQLKHLHVQNNAKLAYIINEKVGFPNLTWLAVSELNGLRFLLSSSMARSLSQLKRLQISGCQIMEEVISIEESNQEIAQNFFPQLQDLELKDLPNLTKLCSTSYVELPNPSYERLQLEVSTATGGICEEVEKIHSKRNLDIVRQHFIFENKVEFPNLKKLSLNGLAKLTTIWNNQLSLGSSKNLETIEIVSCDNLKSVFSASVAKSLQRLRSLEVKNCGVEEIISQEEGVLMAPMFVFSKVSYVRFQNLPKLKRFYPGLHDCKWPSLETLEVYDCNEVHIFADGTRELNNLYTPDKQSLFLLEKNLRSSAISFNNLTTLQVSRCNKGLNYLISISMVKSLMQLTKLEVGDCEEMIEIVASSGNDDLANEIEFRVLKHLKLSNLPSLRGLCSGARIVKFPCLENLSMTGCTQLEGFVFDSTDKSTLGNNIEDANSNENIDTEVVQRFVLNNKVELPRLMSLSLEGLTKLTAIWHNQLSDNSFDGENLNSVEIDSCESLKYIFPATVAKRLERLSELIVNKCGVEEIVAIEGEPQTMPKFSMHHDSWKKGKKKKEKRRLEYDKTNRPVAFSKATNDGVFNAIISTSSISLRELDCDETLFRWSRLRLVVVWRRRKRWESRSYLEMGVDGGGRGVEFPNLKKLSLNGLAKLTTIWNNQLSLGSSKNLETIEIVSCDNLKSVFPASVVKSLQQLRSLEVENCGVEEIISQEEGVLMAPMFVFSKVSNVRFQNLPKLKSFYPGLHDCQWPSLETLEVYDCNEVRIFADGTRELNNLYTPDKQSLFLLEKDSFPNLEVLVLDVMENWDSPPLHLLRNLKILNTYAHTNSSLNSLEQLLGLEKVNGETHAAGDATFPFLRELALYGMRKLINLGDDSFGPARLYFPKVEILELIDCDILKNLRSSAISFNYLTTLQVIRCKGLNYLISFSMATCLMQLKKLEVSDCEEMIEIVASSGNDDLANEIEFRVLKHLKLSNLPSLRGFCSGARIVKFPCLENLSMTGCTQLEGFVFDSTDKSTLGNNIEDANSNENIDTEVVQRFLLNNKVELPRLMSLSLEGLTKLTAIWHNQLSDNSFDGENLNSVEIDSCESLKYIFPATVARRLERLSKLIVNKCGVEEIVAIEGEPQTMPKFIFPKVTCVKFTELPNLTSFYPAMHASSWPALQKLEVLGCYKLEILAETLASFQGKYESNQSAPIKQTLFTIEKDSFPNLEALGLEVMENWDSLPLHLFRKLKSLYTYAHTNSSLNSLEQLLGLEKVNGEIHAAGDATFPFLRELHLYGMRKLINLGDDSFGPARLYFPKVEILELIDCDILKNLRSSAISFNYLTTLQVIRCKGLNYLISFSMATCLMQLKKLEVSDCEEMIEIVASSGNDDLANEIEFRVLKHLKLSNLPSLRGFCSGARIVKFPCLENLSMTGCTQLEGFVFDSTDKSTLGNNIEDANSNENIDTEVVQRFLLNNKVELPRLMSLSLEGLTKLTAIWHNQLSDNSFDGENLNSVEIDSCESLKYIFPATVARRLERLSKLIVNKCGVEEIVAIEGEPQTMPKFIFPKVTCVKFTELPNLTSFYPAMHASSWPALQKLEVLGCYKLEILAETLASFQGKYESNQSAPIKQTLFTIEKDSFPSLEDLKLSNMETLNGESSCMHHDVEFPNLKKLSLNGLAKLTTIWNNQFSLGSSKNLETIEIVSCDNLKSVFPASVAKSLQQLRRLVVKKCGVEEIISQEEGVLIAPMFVFSKVSYVRFQNLPKLKSFYPGLHDCKWPSLATLAVYDCNEVRIFADCTRELNNLYTPDKQPLFLLEKDSFPNLEVLGFRVTENWDSPPLHLLRKLKSLYTYAHTNSSLNSLEQLLGLEKVNGETHAAGDATFPFLRELYLYGMRKLINLGDDSFGPARLYFPKVEILELEDCDSLKNLRSSAISFNNLTTLQVRRCKGLNYLISFSMATCLMQLTKLEVGDCEEMIEIVASSGNDDLANEIEFRVLKHLKLSNLPSLRGFCSGARIVKFPCLENLSMTGCTQLEGFVFDSTDKSTLGNNIEDANSNENIDTEVVQRLLLNNKVELPRLMSLSLEGLTKLTAIWHNQLSDNSFDGENLNSVEIDSCESLKYIFPATVAKRIERLSELIVNKCGVEEIVAIEGEPQTMPKFIFPKVTCVKFTELPNLTSFYPAMHASSWPALQTLEVSGCYKLEILAETLASFQGRYESNQSAPINQTLFTIEKDSFPSLEDLKLSGMEIWNGNSTIYYVVLEEIARKIEGARVEDNRFCISVHYRNVREEDYDILEEKVKAVIETYPEFHLTRGKKVLEVRPSIEWNKGHALEYLLDTLGFSNSGDVLPLYIGDDRTDEDAFKVIEARGQGFPIIVSSTPKETKAAYSLHDPSEVLTFLLRLARWRKASSSSRSLAQIWGLGNSHSYKANC